MEAILSGGRIGLAALSLVGVLLGAPAASHGRCDMPVRVLVARGAGAVELSVDGRRRVLDAQSGRLRVDGQPVGERWESGPADSARVGGLRVGGRLLGFVHAGAVTVVNEVPLEQYVAGAIGGEMPASWAADALRAQAVASRSYVLHQRILRGDRPWDVEAGTRSQVYRGLDAAEPARRAARDTRCEVLTHQGEPILAAFHSASGGRTASSAEVWGRDLSYLVSHEVPGEDDSPDTYWRAAIPAHTLARALDAAGHSIGEVRGAAVEERTPSGRVRWIRFQGEGGQVRLSGRQLRGALGESTLRSTLFELRLRGDVFVFVGSGSGHGVGMSQWGARSLADRGATYREILDNFYPGTTLGLWDEGRTAAWQPRAE